MSEDVRLFEEYKEMIKDMRKEEMIKGLYDLSKNINEKSKEIERLNNIINELEKFTNARIQKCYDEGCYIQEFDIYNEYHSKIKELRGGSNGKD